MIRRRHLQVEHPGPLTLFQDSGRGGFADLGVSPSGAADRGALSRANTVVGNPPGALALELTFGGLILTAIDDLLLGFAGASCPGVPHQVPFVLRAGANLRCGRPSTGVRSYLAVRGGLSAAAVLGSGSTDVLSGIGPDPVAAGQLIGAGTAVTPLAAPAPLLPAADPQPRREAGEPVLGLLPGPRTDWLSPGGSDVLGGAAFTVSQQSNRVAVRLDGPPVQRRDGELSSEGLTRGAVQLPPSGQPVIFLADHPVSGGYPLVGYLSEADSDRCAQLAPGDRVRLRW